jgi:hypothetical protein
MNTLNEGLAACYRRPSSITPRRSFLRPIAIILEKKLGSFIFTMYEYQLKGFDEKIVPEATEENKLVMQYEAAIASCKSLPRGHL